MTQVRALLLGDDYEELVRALETQRVEMTEDAEEANAVIASYGTSPAALRSALNSSTVQWAQLPTAGIELFADSLQARPELIWTSAKGAYARPVAEHALALTLALLRELPRRVRAETWEHPTGTSLHGLRVTVVGAGGVAQEIVRLVKCFDTHVTVVRRSAGAVPGADRTITDDGLDDVLSDTDVVILAAALTPDTRHMFDARTLALLPAHAQLVNIGRGGLVDTEALLDALRAERLGGAALDVTDPEPLPNGHPLWTEPRALITPHAADTLDMIRPLYAERVAENLRRFTAGETLEGLVDPRAGY